MISEKTVELNVTAELLNVLFRRTRQTHTAIGPTQRHEARLGYDVGYHGSARPLLIQYKRTHRSASGVLSWQLNRTSRRDQLFRLQTIERAGIPVFFAFPDFVTEPEITARRINLLPHVYWMRPLRINPVGGPTGYHTVRFDPSIAYWSVSSDEETELDPPEDYNAVVSASTSAKPMTAEELGSLLDDVFADLEKEPTYDQAQDVEADSIAGDIDGQAFVLGNQPDA